MSSLTTANDDCLGWAARDPSGVLSPYNFSRRAVGSDDISIKITHCGICYADVIWTRNKHGDSMYPLVPGHEIAGIVKEVGSNVHRFKVGDHVGVGTYVNSCRSCEYCNDGQEVHCVKGAVFTFNRVDADGSITKGGYSNYIVVHERYCYRIPDNYPLASAAPLLCAGITVYTPMVHHKMNQPGKSLGVIGLGGLGHMAVKFGKAFGLNVTIFSTSLSKKEEALSVLGANRFVISSDEEQMKALAKSFDFIIDTASGDHPFDPYMSLLKTAGVLVLVGFPSEVKFSPASLNIGMKSISGSAVGGTKVTRPAWANTSCVSIGDVIQGDILIAVLSNYMVDMDWLLRACPTLTKIPNVLVLHGEGDGTLDHMKRNKPANWILHKPPLPISFGTHHSKAMLLVYPRGVRVIVHTANLIYVDWNNKSQGLWMQDFPWKDQNSPSKGCGFETDLIDYLSALKWPEFSVKLPALGNFNINSNFFKKFDYSDAAVRLIASVPGYHTGSNLKKWGHMKLRTVLQECTFDQDFKNSPLAYQFSSLGSLDEKWLAELTSSMSSGFSEDKTPLGLGQPRIIWPTVEDVRCSLEGYAAGNAVPGPLKNVEKEFLKKYWAKWKASHTGRCRAMPHIKTFTRYNGQKLAWLLLTSSNLSKAAWGALQKNNSQLMIRSYELGVLFLPSSIERCGSGFSCTSNGDIKEDKCRLLDNSEVRRRKLVTLTWQGSRNSGLSSEVIPLPVPYELPPQPYTSEDVPWSWDRRYTKKDVYGQVWPRQVQLYTFQDS